MEQFGVILGIEENILYSFMLIDEYDDTRKYLFEILLEIPEKPKSLVILFVQYNTSNSPKLYLDMVGNNINDEKYTIRLYELMEQIEGLKKTISFQNNSITFKDDIVQLYLKKLIRDSLTQLENTSITMSIFEINQ